MIPSSEESRAPPRRGAGRSAARAPRGTARAGARRRDAVRQRRAREDRHAQLDLEPAARDQRRVVLERLGRRRRARRPRRTPRARAAPTPRVPASTGLARAERRVRHALEQLAGAAVTAARWCRGRAASSSTQSPVATSGCRAVAPLRPGPGARGARPAGRARPSTGRRRARPPRAPGAGDPRSRWHAGREQCRREPRETRRSRAARRGARRALPRDRSADRDAGA
jgi:hypothetical protein